MSLLGPFYPLEVDLFCALGNVTELKNMVWFDISVIHTNSQVVL